MKKIFIYFAIMMFVTVSCKEDPIGQTPTDSTPPPAVSNVQVESLPGGAKVSYDLPNVTDISYVKCEYMLNGNKRVVRASIYKNYLIVEGLGSTDPVEITIYTVDHSENVSEPYSTTFTPGTPPISLIFASLAINTDFGGVNVTWENDLAVEIGITVLAADEKGELKEGETLFTNRKDGSHSFRGYDNNERVFAVCITDKWSNVSDTVKGKFTPYLEKVLDKSKHKRLSLPADNTTQYSGSYPFSAMFDGITSAGNMWHTTESGINFPVYFTVDLGVDAKLSRFKMWHRFGTFHYAHYNPKTFEVWGASEYKAGMLEDYWKGSWTDDWFFLGDYVTLKPSGMDGPITNDDKAFAEAGFEFSVPLTVPKVQYLRFVVKSTWGGAANLHIAELSFYGNDED